MRANQTLAEAFPIADSADPGFGAQPKLQLVPGLVGDAELTPAQGELYLVTEAAPVQAPNITAELFISADNIPELSAERQKAAQRATSILARNSYKLHNGRADEVPTSVDALGTVRQVVAVKKKFGVESAEYQEIIPGLILDNERLLGETTTRNRAEYFKRARQTFDQETLQYFSHNLSISAMTENGLSPFAKPEEQIRRINDNVEEDGTYVPIGSMIVERGLRGFVELLPFAAESQEPKVSVEVTTISECTDFAEQEHAINPKGSFEGYRPGMRGIAIRRAHFEDDSGDRETEQVIISGVYITHDLIEEFLADKGAIAQDQKLNKNELHGTQFISVNDGGVMHFAQELDHYVGSKLGLNLMLGEVVDHPKDYDRFMEQAEERRKQLAPMPEQLSEFQIELEEQGADSKTAEAMVNNFLKDRLLAIAKKHPELAEIMFDAETAEGFAEVARLEAAGKHKEAMIKQLEVEANAPEVSYCGAGGCAGLENVDPASPAGQMAARFGLRGKLVRNKVSACKNCSEFGLIHDYNGNTVCTSCKSTKLEGQGVKHSKKPSPAV